MPIDLARRLIASGTVQPEVVEAALFLSVVRGIPFARALLDRGAITERALEDELERVGGLALRQVVGEPALLERLPRAMCRRLAAIPTRVDGSTGTVDVAAADPLDAAVAAEFAFHLGAPVRLVRAPIGAIEEAIRHVELDDREPAKDPGRRRRKTPPFPHGAPTSPVPPPPSPVPPPFPPPVPPTPEEAWRARRRTMPFPDALHTPTLKPPPLMREAREPAAAAEPVRAPPPLPSPPGPHDDGPRPRRKTPLFGVPLMSLLPPPPAAEPADDGNARERDRLAGSAGEASPVAEDAAIPLVKVAVDGGHLALPLRNAKPYRPPEAEKDAAGTDAGALGAEDPAPAPVAVSRVSPESPRAAAEGRSDPAATTRRERPQRPVEPPSVSFPSEPPPTTEQLYGLELAAAGPSLLAVAGVPVPLSTLLAPVMTMDPALEDPPPSARSLASLYGSRSQSRRPVRPPLVAEFPKPPGAPQSTGGPGPSVVERSFEGADEDEVSVASDEVTFVMGVDAGPVLRALELSASRDEVVRHVLRGMRLVARRVAMFALKRDGFHGWACNVDFGDAEVLRATVVDAELPSILATAAAASLYLGPVPPNAAHAPLLAVMEHSSRDVAAVAVRVLGRTAMVMLADDLFDTMLATRHLDNLARAAGEALGRLLVGR